MKWIKFMTNAGEDDALVDLMEEYGAAGYGYFWLLVGLCASKYDGNRAFVFRLHVRTISQKLRCKPSAVGRLLTRCEQSKLFSVTKEGNVFVITWPKLLKFAHKDAISSGQRRATGGPEAGPIKGEENRREERGSPPVSSADLIAQENELKAQAAETTQSIITALGEHHLEADARTWLTPVAWSMVETLRGWDHLKSEFKKEKITKSDLSRWDLMAFNRLKNGIHGGENVQR